MIFFYKNQSRSISGRTHLLQANLNNGQTSDHLPVYNSKRSHKSANFIITLKGRGWRR